MEASNKPAAHWSFRKKPAYEHGSGCGGQGTGERLAIKSVSSRLEDYPSFSYPPSGPPVHTAHKPNKEILWIETVKRKPKSKRVCHSFSAMPLVSILEPSRFMWPCPRNETIGR